MAALSYPPAGAGGGSSSTETMVRDESQSLITSQVFRQTKGLIDRRPNGTEETWRMDQKVAGQEMSITLTRATSGEVKLTMRAGEFSNNMTIRSPEQAEALADALKGFAKAL